MSQLLLCLRAELYRISEAYPHDLHEYLRDNDILASEVTPSRGPSR